jgi:hypothetical protein
MCHHLLKTADTEAYMWYIPIQTSPHQPQTLHGEEYVAIAENKTEMTKLSVQLIQTAHTFIKDEKAWARGAAGAYAACGTAVAATDPRAVKYTLVGALFKAQAALGVNNKVRKAAVGRLTDIVGKRAIDLPAFSRTVRSHADVVRVLDSATEVSVL